MLYKSSMLKLIKSLRFRRPKRPRCSVSSSHSYVIDMQAVRHIKQAFPYESSGFRVGSLQLYIVSRRRHFPSRAHHCPANLLTPAITRDHGSEGVDAYVWGNCSGEGSLAGCALMMRRARARAITLHSPLDKTRLLGSSGSACFGLFWHSRSSSPDLRSPRRPPG